MKLLIWVALAALTFFVTAEARTEETSHLAFVNEYIRGSAEYEDTRATSERELASASTVNEKLLDAIHRSTLFQLALKSQIGMLTPGFRNPGSITRFRST